MFSDWLNGAESVATSGMFPNTAMTSLDEKDYKLWERTNLSLHNGQIRRTADHQAHGVTVGKNWTVTYWALLVFAQSGLKRFMMFTKTR